MNSEARQNQISQLLLLPRKILLIDDDFDFSSIMAAAAESMEIDIHCLSSLSQLGPASYFGGYDLIILDYFLENERGDQIAERLELISHNTPIVLISADPKVMTARQFWPDSVRGLVVKNKNVLSLLREVIILTLKEHPGTT